MEKDPVGGKKLGKADGHARIGNEKRFGTPPIGKAGVGNYG
jgi:hypothetical protein